MSGWIKLHRQITDWEWYDDHNTFRLFMHLLLKANHKERSYRGVKIEVGCVMTGRELLSKETGLSVQQIRTCLERLKSTNEITIKSDKQGTIIQVVKYKDYQVTTNESTTNQPTSNQQVTTNKNVKKEKNDNTIPSLEEFMAYGLSKLEDVSHDALRLKYESWIANDWCITRDNISKPILRWKNTLLNTLPYLSKQPKQQTIISDFVYKDESNMTDEELWAYAKEKMEHRKKEIAIYG
jgi:hypothetical protein